MKSFRTLFPVLGVVVALAGITGCSAESSANGSVDSANSVQSKSTAANDTTANANDGARPHMGPPGGPEMLLFASLHEDIGLSDAQKTTIKGLIEQNRPNPADMPKPDASHTASLAAAIRAGKVDGTTFAGPSDKMKAAHEAHQAKAASALATLHDTLTPAQRAQLVDAVQARGAKMGAMGPAGHHGGPDGRGPEGRGPEGRGGPDGRGPGGPEGRFAGPRGEGGPMGHMLADLNLTQDQKDQIKAKLDAERPQPTEADHAAMKAKLEAMKTAMDAKLQTFKADSFDAKAFVAPPAGALEMGPPRDHMAKELSIIVSVLNADQREALAKKIEAGPTMTPPPAAPQQ